jgi:hypothetical protein
MASRLAKKFDTELVELFRDRTHALRAQIWLAPGAVATVTKTRIQKSIEKLQDIAETAALRSRASMRIFRDYDYKRQWHPKKNKGFGRAAKRRTFKAWYDQHITTKNCVYVFWKGKRCLYVGRTLNGKGRPSSHFEKHWFSQATRIDVYAFDRKRSVPRFECMLTHRHAPSYSRMKPASKKFYTRCPVCEMRQHIRNEVKSLFRLK